MSFGLIIVNDDDDGAFDDSARDDGLRYVKAEETNRFNTMT